MYWEKKMEFCRRGSHASMEANQIHEISNVKSQWIFKTEFWYIEIKYLDFFFL